MAALLELDPQAAFVFVAVEKEPPYLVSVTEWDGEAMQEGALLMRQAIDTYARSWSRTSGAGISRASRRFICRGGRSGRRSRLVMCYYKEETASGSHFGTDLLD